MKQFFTIFSFEFKAYLKNKVFVGITLFLVALTAVIMFFPRIIGAFDISSDVSDDEAKPVMLVKADGTLASNIVKENFAAVFVDYSVESTEQSVAQIKESIASGKAECAFVLTDGTSYKYYVNTLSLYDTNTVLATEVMQTLYQISAMINGGMSPDNVQDVMSVQISGETESLGVDQSENFLYTYIMIFALYMVILLYGQMVATNVATEKSSRAMELLVTSAKPANMMFGKVLASCLAGLLQLTVTFGSSVLFYSLNKSYWGDNPIIASLFNMPAQLLLYMLVFFVLGFLIYAFMYGAVGSTATKLEDINTSVMPVTMMFLIGFMVVMISFASGEVDNTLMKTCSFVPFTSPMAMFTRIAMSTVPWFEVAASVVILALSAVGIGVISAKIYRVGVLLYGTKPKFGSIIKSVFKA